MTRTLRWLVLLTLIGACDGGRDDTLADGDVSATATPTLAGTPIVDSTLRRAAAEIDAGHPWRATKRLAPVVSDSARRTPEAILLAARAAAGWEGWPQVERLLQGATWIDTTSGGLGRELLARAALEQGHDTVAVGQATSALADARDARARGVRTVLLARALDRVNSLDSASAAYRAAADRLPVVRDWLLLRAAGVERDSSRRAALYAGVRSAAARTRVPWTEAQALERNKQLAQAAARYAALGAMASAYRLRFAAATDSASRNALAAEVVRFVASRAGTGQARDAVDVLDRSGVTLSPQDELTIARSAVASGPVARAIAAYGRASSLLSDADRLRYGELLGRAGQYAAARAELDKVTSAQLAGDAAYQRARIAMLAGDRDAAKSALRDVATRYASDASAAPDALYLLADLRTDDGADADARELYRRLYTKYPSDSHADEARFHAGIIAYVAGDARTAAHEMDSLVALYPKSDEVNAGLYWAGRSYAKASDAKSAAARWREVARRDPLSYYAGLAAKRLHTPDWRPAPARGAAPRDAAVDSAVARLTMLRELGMDVEARFEIDALEDGASASPARLVATATALRDHGEPSRGIRLALRAIDQGMRDARVYRLAYPRIDADALEQAAAARKLGPAFVAGLIRQESSWNPRAVSVAGARGLMQVMPSVGASVARSLRFPVWDGNLLFDPDANLEIGTAHLAGALRDTPDRIRALAAYNAGAARVTRWATKQGVDDPEVFAERIPFVETRDYVRIVTRNAEVYRVLY